MLPAAALVCFAGVRAAARAPWRLRTGLTRTRPCTSGRPPAPASMSADVSSRSWFRKSSPRVRDPQEREEGQRASRRNTPRWYFVQCKKLIRAQQLQEALDLFSRDMLAAQRLQPEESNYSVLIGGCGRGGRLREAFALYNQMKKRGLRPSDATYTALFNACAESRRQPAGLQRALQLEQELRRQGCPLSAVTYHALLKVHARHNHLQACLYTLQEMVQRGHAVTPQTFHYLLMACVKDRDAGFRLALQVWRQMLCSGLRPDSQNYNLLLRAARDCALGDPGLASRLLLRPLRTRQDPDSRHKSDPVEVEQLLQQQPLLARAAARPRDAGALISAAQNQKSTFAPNLLDLLEGTRGEVVSLGPVAEAADRLTLIGGAESLLHRMAATGQRPDLRTLTLLADMMEPGPRTMETLLEAAKGHKVKLDTAFFNCAIRRAAKAGALEAAQDVLRLMRQRRVSADLRTFGSLALGCERPQQALQLLRDVEEAGFKPNLHIFSALVGRATRRLDYVYLKLILKTMRRLEVWPDQLLIRQLEFAARYPPDYDQFKSRNNYLVHIDGFRGYYQQWLREMPAVEADDQQEALQTQEEQRGPGSEVVAEREREELLSWIRSEPGARSTGCWVAGSTSLVLREGGRSVCGESKPPKYRAEQSLPTAAPSPL